MRKLLYVAAGSAAYAAANLMTEHLNFPGLEVGNWSLGNGLVGVVAGLAPLVVSRVRRQWLTILAAAAVGAVAMVLGAGVAAMTDVFVANLTPDTAISAEWIPLVTWNLIWGLPLLVIVLSIWPVVRRRVAR